MFYEQNKIEPFLKCSKCYEKFDEPRVLPCGKTVCSLCLKTLITDKKKEGCFECCMCQASHNTNAEFPVNELVKGLMRTCEVLQSDLVKKFKANLKDINLKKAEFKEITVNPWNVEGDYDRVKKHCIDLRIDVDLETKTAIALIHGQRDDILEEIDRYELNCNGLIDFEAR